MGQLGPKHLREITDGLELPDIELQQLHYRFEAASGQYEMYPAPIV